ncbi:tetratricopeptide repeat protein [Microaerobacter geothermalis]|uniref:tetratricopeptide repeat protein n=1 Tax=Microaerobacter geothermalis TaxID=674972 RepID=UPI001F225C72|nr:tetratricopeptide repeat protein [Microaerobacter geothermalis]MCF6094291.1 tetratricopeptide repeat protein [Microaerobacter geothermalis]
MSIAKLSNIENGKVQPDLETWEYLKNKLGLSDEMIYEKGSTDSVDYILEQAETYYSTGFIEKAKEKYENALQLAEKSMFIEQSAKAHKALGLMYLEEENYKEAQLFLEKAIELFEQENDEENVIECKIKIGAIYFRQEKYTKALDQIYKIFENIPSNQLRMKGILYYNMASTFYALKDMINANYACERALHYLTENETDSLISALNLQGILLRSQKMYLLAREKLEKAKQIAIKHKLFIPKKLNYTKQ